MSSRPKRLKTLGNVGLAVLAAATLGVVGAVALTPQPSPPVSDTVASAYAQGTQLATPTPAPPRGLAGAKTVTAEIRGQKANLLLPPNPNGTLVIAAHGHGTDVAEWSAGDPNKPKLQTAMLNALMDSGFAVATSDAHMNAWGNPDSVADYTELAAWARGQGKFTSTALIGQSMGGLATLQLLGSLPDVSAWVGIYPVCNLSTVVAAFSNTAQAWPEGTQGVLSPVPSGDLAGKRLLFFASPADTVVPKATNTDICAANAKKAGAADVRVITVSGEHGHPSAFQPREVIAFLAAK